MILSRTVLLLLALVFCFNSVLAGSKEGDLDGETCPENARTLNTKVAFINHVRSALLIAMFPAFSIRSNIRFFAHVGLRVAKTLYARTFLWLSHLEYHSQYPRNQRFVIVVKIFVDIENRESTFLSSVSEIRQIVRKARNNLFSALSFKSCF